MGTGQLTPPPPGDTSKSRTIPLDLTGVPTNTITQRPWTVYITLGVSVTCVVTLAIVHMLGQYNTAQTTLDRLITALSRGDVDTLISDRELGFSERASNDLRQRGLEEYNKIMAAFSTCSTAGLERYRSLRTTVLLRGEEAFKKLPADKQREIRQQSRDTWELEAGLKALGAEGCGGIDDPAVFTDPVEAEPYLLTLGLKRMAESKESEEQDDLPALDELKSWNKKPTKQQRDVIARVRASGEEALAQIEKDVRTTGGKLFKGLPARERKEINAHSRNLWIIEKGIELLDDEEKVLISGPDMFLDDADEDEQARLLCMEILPPAKKALLEGRDYADFTAKREDYIRSTGRERYEHFLKVLFASCKHEVVQTTLSGNDPFDLMRISRATYILQWKDCQGAAGYLGETLTFQFDGRSWNLVTQVQVQPKAAEPVAPPAELAP
jgi:hypothetical protein